MSELDLAAVREDWEAQGGEWVYPYGGDIVCAKEKCKRESHDYFVRMHNEQIPALLREVEAGRKRLAKAEGALTKFFYDFDCDDTEVAHILQSLCIALDKPWGYWREEGLKNAETE